MSELLFRVGRIFLNVYAVVLLTALGGLLGANFTGLIVALSTSDLDASSPLTLAGKSFSWAHVGWIGGALIAFLGALTGHVRFFRGHAENVDSGETNEKVLGRSEIAAATPELLTDDHSQVHVVTMGPVKTIAIFTLAGLILGMVLGASLVVPWFSIAYSPFAPQGWQESVKVEQKRTPGTPVKRNVHTSSHPVIAYLFLVPAGLGAVVGGTIATAGLIAASMTPNGSDSLRRRGT